MGTCYSAADASALSKLRKDIDAFIVLNAQTVKYFWEREKH